VVHHLCLKTQAASMLVLTTGNQYVHHLYDPYYTFAPRQPVQVLTKSIRVSRASSSPAYCFYYRQRLLLYVYDNLLYLACCFTDIKVTVSFSCNICSEDKSTSSDEGSSNGDGEQDRGKGHYYNKSMQHVVLLMADSVSLVRFQE
jgi:hypothetical protein